MKSSILPRSSPLRLTTLSPMSVLAERLVRPTSDFLMAVDMKPPETKRTQIRFPRDSGSPDGTASTGRAPGRTPEPSSTLSSEIPRVNPRGEFFWHAKFSKSGVNPNENGSARALRYRRVSLPHRWNEPFHTKAEV